MSNKLQSATADFDSAATDRNFVYLGSKDTKVTIETSHDHKDIVLCDAALRVMGAFDYGAGPEAQKVMVDLVNDAEKAKQPLRLTLEA
ncbi:MAG: hypothetical protein DI551_03490 [Micavibrio aeruginosavorus]|uniref:Uncharacterized protein n=1 Tax=Micavibrio aeruginosavorus TaxID=349221 RepID=A0A2W5N4U5_9BACT|nr:MAG: hypothetical protein DI551_03490 [Micavibrio aeruginosavorus]